ncbi:hypothetical protein NDU88_004014, partial [Pleurodeles waltl]
CLLLSKEVCFLVVAVALLVTEICLLYYWASAAVRWLHVLFIGCLAVLPQIGQLVVIVILHK